MRGISMKNMFIFLIIGLYMSCFASLLFAAPVPPVGPVDIEGTIIKAPWFPEELIKGNPNMTGTAHFDRKIPARFMLHLKDYSGINAKSIDTMKMVYRWSVSDNLNSLGMPEYIVLRLSHPDKTFFKEGMRVRVRAYKLMGDEDGDWTTFEEIHILPDTSGNKP